MRGEATPHGAGELGRLPAEYHASARRADYVVWSYATPIAWHVPASDHLMPEGSTAYAGGWIMPDQSYSVTTGKQQGRIRTALSVLWDSAYDKYATPQPAPAQKRRRRPQAVLAGVPAQRIPGPGPALDQVVFGPSR
jgi:hypothetical protein